MTKTNKKIKRKRKNNFEEKNITPSCKATKKSFSNNQSTISAIINHPKL